MSCVKAIAALLLCLLPPCAAAQGVIFINPGKSDEIYWVTTAHAMRAAARDLGMALTVRYAEREPLRTIEIAREVAAMRLGERPEYAILTNDNGTGPEQLRILDAAGVKTFFAYSTITREQRTETGAPRERHRGWIGSLEPRAEDAGYLTARALIAAARRAGGRAADGKVHMLAIGGDRSTPSSIRRNEGLYRAVAEAGDVALEQVVYAGWAREKAAEQAEWLYQRHPEARAVWAANDLMAFGAMQAWRKRGGHPGGDAWFSGVNTSREALDALRAGELAALAGGHFITGAFALVMIYDYAHGHDFASEGLELDRPMFTLFDATKADRYAAIAAEGFRGVDFRGHSKVLNRRLARYDFDFGRLLRPR